MSVALRKKKTLMGLKPKPLACNKISIIYVRSKITRKNKLHKKELKYTLI